MTSIAENPAVTDPRKALTPTRQDALCAIDFYRGQRRLPNGRIEIGKKRFSAKTLQAIEDMKLIRKTPDGFAPTMAGRLAAAKLRGEIQ